MLCLGCACYVCTHQCVVPCEEKQSTAPHAARAAKIGTIERFILSLTNYTLCLSCLVSVPYEPSLLSLEKDHHDTENVALHTSTGLTCHQPKGGESQKEPRRGKERTHRRAKKQDKPPTLFRHNMKAKHTRGTPPFPQLPAPAVDTSPKTTPRPRPWDTKHPPPILYACYVVLSFPLPPLQPLPSLLWLIS
jgi:hypothetical protein